MNKNMEAIRYGEVMKAAAEKKPRPKGKPCTICTTPTLQPDGICVLCKMDKIIRLRAEC